MIVRNDKQSLDISGGVHDGKDDLEVSTTRESCSSTRMVGRSVAVTEVRKISVADDCDQTARLRRRSNTCEQSTGGQDSAQNLGGSAVAVY